MLFGIYPGSVAGDDHGQLAAGPRDDHAKIDRAVMGLQGEPGRPFLVRAYLSFTDDTVPDAEHPTLTPVDAAALTGDGRSLDLVAQFQSLGGDVDGYCAFVQALVQQYGPVTSTLQITEEPNVSGLATLDGDYPRVRDALVAGVSAAKHEARTLGHHHLRIGFNTTPLFGPATTFPAELAELGGDRFRDDLDYVGLDFFPDVFSPIAPENLAGAVTWLLSHHRHEVLTPAGLGDTPIHVTENGWPTGPARSNEQQAIAVRTIVSGITAAETGLNVKAYIHFSLRDADTSRDTLFHRFGLMTDHYQAKPAWETYRGLIDELGSN